MPLNSEPLVDAHIIINKMRQEIAQLKHGARAVDAADAGLQRAAEEKKKLTDEIQRVAEENVRLTAEKAQLVQENLQLKQENASLHTPAQQQYRY